MTATKHRRVTLAHEEGDEYSTPISVYVHGHDLTEDEAREIAQRELDEWTESHGEPEDGRHLVNIGTRTHLRMIPGRPGGDYEGVTMYHTGYSAGPGAIPIWDFEVDEHLEPRCQIAGCNIRWSRGPGWNLPVLMCANHARLAELTARIDVAEAMLQKNWILGETEDDRYFGQWTEQRRREWALDHLSYNLQTLERALRDAATIIPALAADGFTLPLEWDRADGEAHA